MQNSTERRRGKGFRAHAPTHGICDNLSNALKLLANQQLGSDSLVEVLVVEGFHERGRLKMMDELRMFILVGTHVAVEIGDVENTLESLSVVVRERGLVWFL